MDSVTEVMREVVNWEVVAQRGTRGRRGLGVSDSRIQEFKLQSSSEKDKSGAVGSYWVNTDPFASWTKLTNVLYRNGEERALAMVKKYFGTCIS